MKGKLIFNYFISLITGCFIILTVNILLVKGNIYNQDKWYNYKPEKIMENLKKAIYLDENQNIKIENSAISLLENEKAGIQILDSANKEIFNYNKPRNAKELYTNKTLIEVYNNKNNTVFLDEVIINSEIFTYMIFLDANKINRINYSYDVKSLKIAHNFPFIIGINIVLILAMSLLFTLKITKPINKIIDKIIDLSNEKYTINQSKKGIYSKVENCLIELTKKLILNEQERNRIEKMREEWICNITHDIKTPLTSIIGNAEILADSEYKISDEVKERYCKTIIGKSEYIKTLIEDLNLSTRLKNNSLILNKKKVNIVSLVRHIIIDIVNDEKYNYNNISFTYSKEEIFLEIDEELIKRVFVNLIINAFIHNSKDVKININIEQIENKNAHITIKDNGKGISKEELYNIFKRYYRGTNTLKKIEGSGLGMAIAHDIIKVHNAQIKVESELGNGLEIDINF